LKFRQVKKARELGIFVSVRIPISQHVPSMRAKRSSASSYEHHLDTLSTLP